jgi:hypothetical protein
MQRGARIEPARKCNADLLTYRNALEDVAHDSPAIIIRVPDHARRVTDISKGGHPHEATSTQPLEMSSPAERGKPTLSAVKRIRARSRRLGGLR